MRNQRIVGCAIGVVAALMLGGCGGGEAPRAEPENDVSQSTDLAMRAEIYETDKQLLGDSTVVVTGNLVDEPPAMLEGYGDKITPLAEVAFRVRETVEGSYSEGDIIRLALEGNLDEEGILTSDRLEPGTEYLLFLRAIGEKAPDVYAVTGYLAGIYQADDSGAFLKTDAESVELPESLTVEGLIEKAESQR